MAENNNDCSQIINNIKSINNYMMNNNINNLVNLSKGIKVFLQCVMKKIENNADFSDVEYKNIEKCMEHILNKSDKVSKINKKIINKNTFVKTVKLSIKDLEKNPNKLSVNKFELRDIIARVVKLNFDERVELFENIKEENKSKTKLYAYHKGAILYYLKKDCAKKWRTITSKLKIPQRSATRYLKFYEVANIYKLLICTAVNYVDIVEYFNATDYSSQELLFLQNVFDVQYFYDNDYNKTSPKMDVDMSGLTNLSGMYYLF